MTLLVQYTLIYASVLILVALGGCFAEHSGVINLGLEGIMIMGALGGALTLKYLCAAWQGVPAIVLILSAVLVAALVGLIYSLLLSVACVTFNADQTIVGTAPAIDSSENRAVFRRATQNVSLVNTAT